MHKKRIREDKRSERKERLLSSKTNFTRSERNMKLKTFRIMGLLLSLLILTFSLAGQGRQRGIHASVGYAWPRQDNLGSALASSLGLDFQLRRNWRLVLDFSYARFPVNFDPQGLMEGTLVSTPFWIRLQYSFFPGPISPYLGGGAGYVFNRFQMEGMVTIPEVTISQKVDDDWGFIVGIGVEWRLKGEQATLFGEINYLTCSPPGVTSINDMNFGRREERFSVDLNSWQLRLGIRYFY